MKKNEIIQILQDAIGSEEPILLPPSDLDMLTADDLPEGTIMK